MLDPVLIFQTYWKLFLLYLLVGFIEFCIYDVITRTKDSNYGFSGDGLDVPLTACFYIIFWPLISIYIIIRFIVRKFENRTSAYINIFNLFCALSSLLLVTISFKLILFSGITLGKVLICIFSLFCLYIFSMSVTSRLTASENLDQKIEDSEIK